MTCSDTATLDYKITLRKEWETRQSHVAVSHWKLFFKTFTETACPTIYGQPCKKSTPCYHFLEGRVQTRTKPVGMLVSEVYETGGCATRMGSFAAFVKVECKTTVIREQCWQRDGFADSKNSFYPFSFSNWMELSKVSLPRGDSALPVCRQKGFVKVGWAQGSSTGPPSIRGDSFWEMSFTNVSSSLHKQKHNSTRRVAVVS